MNIEFNIREYYRTLLAADGDSRFPVHLQWFAAEDEGRTEEPTEHKIRKAREEGKVAKSAEFTSSIVLLFPIIAIGLLSSYLWRNMEEMLKYYLNLSTQIDVTTDAQLVLAFFHYFIRLFAPPALIAFTAALLANILQVGFLFSTKPITPDFNKIVPNFSRFLKKAFFSGEALFNFWKSIMKVVIIGIIAYINIRLEIGTIIKFVNAPYQYSFISIAGIAFRILIESALAMLLLSLPDYLFQKRQHRESLKMTKQEVKEERKTMEGDPLIRSRMRERMRDLLNQNMLRNVPEADVVVTNPTHFAVGLEWKQERMNAPTVIAKGQDNMAQRIREIARENEVPIIENKPLARALYAEVEIGDEIPERYYEVMAIVISEVYRMKGQERVS
ncbi:MAG: flagellar biosynthesis protein FlhB [Sediminispirochaetaceae bacterium]